jgi:hypothetical protein
MFQIQGVNEVYCIALSQVGSRLTVTTYQNYSFRRATVPTNFSDHDGVIARPCWKCNRAWMNAEDAEFLS